MRELSPPPAEQDRRGAGSGAESSAGVAQLRYAPDLSTDAEHP